MKQTPAFIATIKKIQITFGLTCLLTQLYDQVEVTGLKCEYRENPLGIETLHPRLSWQLRSQQKNVEQTAYRILVADNIDLLAKNIGNIWDSKKTVSDASIQIKYNGAKLLPTKAHL
ncbi:hypothetical protein EZ456_14035 [Pedobacter psychrodurus]|uniref:Uncharacterized protein n=1 Tax=Pedobacter psychrodurus TaxID=2530456 RepID=A0A4R0PV11_9SPHI|nr:hypothetical protein [Pedobacter psychrodurus]TCD26411.1 hypothetical protein EZ456_14035 [Pedobacter psychrodurus]